jgi:hypothetical protein
MQITAWRARREGRGGERGAGHCEGHLRGKRALLVALHAYLAGHSAVLSKKPAALIFEPAHKLRFICAKELCNN